MSLLRTPLTQEELRRSLSGLFHCLVLAARGASCGGLAMGNFDAIAAKEI